jgi:hypothetical protein
MYRQLALAPATADEDGDQLDLLEEVEHVAPRKHAFRTPGPAYLVCIECGHGRGYTLHAVPGGAK